MRIAIVCFSAAQGGLELAPLRRGEELRRRGHHVMAVLPGAPELVGAARSMGHAVEEITPVLPYMDLSAARKLHVILKREEIDVAVVARTRDLSTVMLAAGKEVAVVLYQQMQSGVDKRDWFHDRVYRRLDGCVAITERTRDQLVTHTVLAPEKVSVVYYGIDTGRYSPEAITSEDARREFGLPGDAFVVGIVGGFNPGKGQREFIEALGIACQLEPSLAEKLHAILVGIRSTDDPAYVESLHELRRSLPIADRIAFHPFVDDPRHSYRALDIFVLASHSETFGMVLQEALAMGTASIATDSGGVPEMIDDGVNGLLVPPRDARAIAEAIVRLYRDPELRQRLASEGRRLAIERYDLERQTTMFERVLEEALARRREE